MGLVVRADKSVTACARQSPQRIVLNVPDCARTFWVDMGVPSTRPRSLDAYQAARAHMPIKFRIEAGHLVQHSSTRVAVYVALSLGIYAIYWNYAVCKGLRRAIGQRGLRPGLDLLLTLLTGGLYGLWLPVRHARRIHAASLYFERRHVDVSRKVALALIVAPLTLGLSGLWAVWTLQEQLNAFCVLAERRERERRERREDPDPAPSVPAVALDSVGALRVSA